MEFRILGPLEVVREGEPLPLRAAKHRSLLALLVLHANELVSYESAPHSFFDRHVAEHERACRDAWARVQGFIGANR